ncbi:MAG: SIR2 family protein [Bacteroidota bacterium]
MKNKQILLVGNGINRIDNDYAWEDLMQDLLDFTGLKDAITFDEKPFPLLYEEIFLRWAERVRARELSLKKKIRELLRKIQGNDLHRQIMELPVDEILTTNYDYNLEASQPGGLDAAPYIRPIKGSKYSLLRRRRTRDKIVWHIHGEIRAPGSILLGYEQYAGYLQTIRNYVISGIRYKDLTMTPLNQRIRKEEPSIQAWIDHFFFSDVYIIGLSLDFVEMHLWWILDFRARLYHNSEVKVQNRIYFIYPAQDTAWIKPRIDLLCACEVSCIAVPVVRGDWAGMYEQVLAYVKNMTEKNGG